MTSYPLLLSLSNSISYFLYFIRLFSFDFFLFITLVCLLHFFFFFSSRRRHTRFDCDWSSDVCSSDLLQRGFLAFAGDGHLRLAAAAALLRLVLFLEEVNVRFLFDDHRAAAAHQAFAEIGRASCRERV